MNGMSNYTLQLTDACNFRCTYCPQPSNRGLGYRPFILTEEEIDEQLEPLIKKENIVLGRKGWLTIAGGEPILFPKKLQYMFAKYHQYFDFELLTNGSIRKELQDDLIKEFRPQLAISLDDPETNDQQRIGNVKFKDILSNALYWHQYTTVLVSPTLTPISLRRMKEIFDFYVQEGFDHIFIGCVEEWMNDHYWAVYREEVDRLIQTTDIETLRRINLSPWQRGDNNGLELQQIGVLGDLRPAQKVFISKYYQNRYYGHVSYCKRVGDTPRPIVPEGVEAVLA